MLTFKDLKRIVSLEVTAQQQSGISKRLQGKPFWIWDIDKQENIKTNRDCCFN
jgi:hypothetical protein